MQRKQPKLYFRGTPRPEVFPFTEGSGSAVKKLGNKNPSGRGQSGQVVSTDGLHPTIGAGGGNPNRKRDIGWSSGYIQQLNQPKIPEGAKIRRLTPLECERLQGLPDDWTAKGIDEESEETTISDTQRYKLCGNGVTVNVVEEIVKRMIKNENK